MTHQPEIKIVNSDFWVSANDIKSLPNYAEEISPSKEIVFLGRSNVGKSSLINAVLGKKNIARVGKTPGATKVFCFYKLDFIDLSAEDYDPQASVPFSGIFVDVPGFGYAKVSIKERKKWLEMIFNYLYNRTFLQTVVLLLDVRRDPGKEELEVLNMGKDGGIILCLTKCDKANRSEISKRKNSLIKTTCLSQDDIFEISTVTKDSRSGVSKLRNRILQHFI